MLQKALHDFRDYPEHPGHTQTKTKTKVSSLIHRMRACFAVLVVHIALERWPLI